MLEIIVDLEKKCQRCGKGGATQNGLCLKCIVKETKEGQFDNVPKAIKEIVRQAIESKTEDSAKECDDRCG